MSQRYRLGVFPLLAFIAALIIFIGNQAVILRPDGAARTYLRSALAGNLGYGVPVDYKNSVSFADLEPGDIILGAYPNCAYGYYSHAAIYLGAGQILEGYADLGIVRQSIEHFREYPRVCLLRVDAEPAVKQAAVSYALGQLGEVFCPVAFKAGQNNWNCTKIMWKAYQIQGLDIDENNDLWVLPDSIYESGYTSVIRENGPPWL